MRRKNLQLRLLGGQATNQNPASSADKLQSKSGFVMLFSVLISSMLVVIGLSIFNITLKELTISTSSRESQIAFYAANSGIECALYWDLKGNGSRSAFASTTVQAEKDSAKTVDARCNGVKVNSADPVNDGGSAKTSALDILVEDSGDSCFSITVSKTPGLPVNKMTTVIESRGRNVCGAIGRRVERGLKATIITDM